MTSKPRRAAFLAAALLTASLARPVTAIQLEEMKPMRRHGLVEWMLESVSEWVAKIGAEAEPHGSPAPPENNDTGTDIDGPQRMGPEAEPHG